jgi:hypothetical protein
MVRDILHAERAQATAWLLERRAPCWHALGMGKPWRTWALAAGVAAAMVCAEARLARAGGRADACYEGAAPAALPPAGDGRHGGGDEPLDPRSTGWSPGKKSALPWVLIAIGGALVIGGAIAGIWYWNDQRVHFPDDTIGVRAFRP